MWARVQCLLWLGLLLAPQPSSVAETDTAESTRARVRTAFSRHDLDAAAAEIDRQLDQNPDSVEWLLFRADLIGARGRAAEALAETRSVRERHPDSRLARVKEAQWLSRLGRLNAAQAIYQDLLEQAPSAEIRTLLGMTYQWQGDWARADELCTTARREVPEDNLPLLAQLRGLVAMGQPSRAWILAREADLATGESDAELGLILAGIAGAVDAFDALERFATRPTESVELLRAQRSLRARHLARAGDHARARQLLQSIAETRPLDYDAFIESANGYAAMDDPTQARHLYLRALELTPERPEAWLGLARLASREGRLSGSLALYQRATTENPEAFEGWLGQIRMAQLLDDPGLAETALQEAWRLASHSALLHREQLRLALRRGDLEAFTQNLRDYLHDQPGDRVAQLTSARLRVMNGEPVSPDELRTLFDPMAPEIGAQWLRLASRASNDAANLLDELPAPPDKEFTAAANTALAQRVALLAEPRVALELARRGNTATAEWVDRQAWGWWSYLSTPVAVHDDLGLEFDPQSRAVWLANQLQQRLRTVTVETESTLEEDWWLTRAAWFQQWSGRRGSTEASIDLLYRIRRLVSGWEHPIRSLELDEARRRSEQALPDEAATLPRQLTQARWRQLRFDYAGALNAFRQLAKAHPDSADPVYAQAQILRASGRWSEATDLLQQLAATTNPPPLVRLAYAELLRRLRRFDEARRQLDDLAAEGFDEPDLFLHRAQLARSEHADTIAETWLQQGRQRFPQATELARFQAEWWLERQRVRDLSAMLTDPRAAVWAHPDFLAAAWTELEPDRREAILGSAAWWFNWQWLPWERLEARARAALDRRAALAAAAGHPELALQHLAPALEARIPESELWLKAARLYDYSGQHEASARAYDFAESLGLGRPDATVSRLIQASHRQPLEAARAFALLLESQPDDPALRKGLVTALLRAGEINAASVALAPLVSGAAEDVEVQMLAAEVKSAQGRIRQGRSLYNSILRNDPLAADAHAGLLALSEVSEWGINAGYEYDVLRDTSVLGADFENWQEAFLSTYWRRPFQQTWTLEYRWFERQHIQAHQLELGWTRALDRDWITRLSAGIADDRDIIARWRAAGGLSYRVTDELWAAVDARFLDYTDVDVWQVVPSLTWRWHPRGTVEGRFYFSQNHFESAGTEASVTWFVQTSWEFTRHTLLTLFYAQGDEDSLDPIPGLIANDRYLSVGVRLRVGLNRHWFLEPGYRFENHEQFDLHGIGLTVSRRF